MIVKSFLCNGRPNRVIFGVGCVQGLEEEVVRLRSSRVLILSAPQQRGLAEKAALILGEQVVGIHDKAATHLTVDSTKRGCDLTSSLRADCVVAIGGGSTIGLGKVIALRTGLPTIAIPTTYSGFEGTSVYGLAQNGIKKTGINPRVLPRSIIYDPELTLALPENVSIASGMNAIAHAVEGLYARDGNPVMSLVADEGIRAMSAGLLQLKNDPTQLEARTSCLYGAWLCGTILGSVTMALHHRLCQILMNHFFLPHSQTHAILLPYSIGFNEMAVSGLGHRISGVLGEGSPLASVALSNFAHKINAPCCLKDLGVSEADLDQATDLILARPHWNPRTISWRPVRELLQRAFEGAQPS